MSLSSAAPAGLEFHPLTPDRWMDLETLFERHRNRTCWCMWWRLPRSEFARQLGEANKRAFKAIVESGEVPGVLAYEGGKPVGWCSIGPRESFPALERSWVLKRVDDEPVWSIVCFFIARPFRRQGLMGGLLRAATEYARERGARIVEGYPVEPKGARLSGSQGFMGIASAFREAGFVEILRRSESRPIMRHFMQA